MEREDGITQCVCKICSSYVRCGEDIAFCLNETGQSKCITNEIGCLCPGCPVLEEEDFSHVYFCTRGNDVEQQSRE